MINLITILISLLGYGEPQDYANYTEAQVSNEIILVSNQMEADGGLGHDWDM